MEMRGPGPNRFCALGGASKARWFSRSRLDERLPLHCPRFSPRLRHRPPPLPSPERKLNPGRNSSFIAKTDCRQFSIFGPACQESGSRPRQLASRSLQVLPGSTPIKRIFSKADARFHMRIVHSGTALPDAAGRGVHSIAFKISVFPFRRLMAHSRQNNNEEQCLEAEDGRIPRYFPRG